MYMKEFENWLGFLNDNNFVDEFKKLHKEYQPRKDNQAFKILSTLYKLAKEGKGLRIYAEYPYEEDQECNGILANVDEHGFYLRLDKDSQTETFFGYESFLCFEYEID